VAEGRKESRRVYKGRTGKKVQVRLRRRCISGEQEIAMEIIFTEQFEQAYDRLDRVETESVRKD
jgi:predicted component of type VI protein secretion system